MTLDGAGDGDFVFLLLLKNFSNGVQERDRRVSLALSLLVIGFFFDLTRFFCFDCRSEMCVSQSNSVSSGLTIFSLFRWRDLDFLDERIDKKKRKTIRVEEDFSRSYVFFSSERRSAIVCKGKRLIPVP